MVPPSTVVWLRVSRIRLDAVSMSDCRKARASPAASGEGQEHPQHTVGLGAGVVQERCELLGGPGDVRSGQLRGWVVWPDGPGSR